MPTRSARMNQIAYTIKHGRNKSAARLFQTNQDDLRQETPFKDVKEYNTIDARKGDSIANVIDRRTIKSGHVTTRQRAAILG